MDAPKSDAMWRSQGIKWTVGVIALLLLAIVAGRLLLADTGREFAVKPATGSAQAMSAASDRAPAPERR